jgi:phospholipase/carboxylesterase
MHNKNIHTEGKSIQDAEKALVMLHGRGADARDILGLAPRLNVNEYALLAPQATNHVWYPYSFLEKPEQNEPWLSSALDLVKEVVNDISEQGIAKENIYLLGFSQGACLALEFIARNASRYGGIAAFTGGLIGDRINRDNYSGDFNGMPVFIGTGNPDPHVPLYRVNESVRILKELHADVHFRVYDGRPHTVSQDELDWTNKLIF